MTVPPASSPSSPGECLLQRSHVTKTAPIPFLHTHPEGLILSDPSISPHEGGGKGARLGHTVNP